MNSPFDNLAPPSVFEVAEFEDILQELLAYVQQAVPNYQGLESDPYHLILEAFAYRELYLKGQFNQRLKALLLPYATGGDLDNIATHYDVTRLDDETDLAFRLRILRSLGSLPTAGSQQSYEYHAYSVSSQIDDVYAYSPALGEVNVVVACYQEGALTESLLAQITERLAADKVRPLTDKVRVIPVQEKALSIHALVSCPVPYRTQVKAQIEANLSLPLGIAKGLSLFQLNRLFSVDDVTNVDFITPQTEVTCELTERLVIAELIIQWSES